MSKVKFEYIPVEGADTDAISILEGPYQGLHFHYGSVKFIEREDGQMEMKFNYYILRQSEGFEDNEDFKKFAGDLLVEILEKELPSLTQEASFDEIEDPPVELQENLEQLKEEQEKARLEHAESGTDYSSTSDSQ
jgi:hypothetical protein